LPRRRLPANPPLYISAHFRDRALKRGFDMSRYKLVGGVGVVYMLTTLYESKRDPLPSCMASDGSTIADCDGTKCTDDPRCQWK
jgi:hypothetical protein